MQTRTTKPPRQWAAEIAALPMLEERRAALTKVPNAIRPIVETHLRNTWLWKKHNEAE